MQRSTRRGPFDPEQCYLRWEVNVETSEPEDKVRAVFRFVEDDCDVSIKRQESASGSASSIAIEAKATRFRGAALQCFSALGLRSNNFSPAMSSRGWRPLTALRKL